MARISPIVWGVPLALGAVAAAGIVLATRRLMRQALPAANASYTLPSLHHPVEILRDRWGVAHLTASNESDLFFAQGFVHAQDRLFQMEVNRRVGLGRVSEMIGPLGLQTDRFARFMGWPRAAEAQVAGADAVGFAMLDAYCAGVNAFIQTQPLPAEYGVLGFKPEPWTPRDTASWGAVLGWGLSVNWESELQRLLLLQLFGHEKTADLTPHYVRDYSTILSDLDVGERFAKALIDAYRDLLRNLPLASIPAGGGSNNWVVAAHLSATGRPVVANDPHLPPLFPAFWYENHLRCGSLHVTGFTMPGVPGIVIGHNEHVAWGVTNAFPDVQDLVLERFDPDDPTRYEIDGVWHSAETHIESIRMRGWRTVKETIRSTVHGPIISDFLAANARGPAAPALALQWVVHTPSNHMRTLYDSMFARTSAEFHDSLRHWGFPSQNVVYADVAGNIGYTMPGKVPRRKLGDGLVPVPGWDSRYGWDGWLDFEELPHAENPPAGLIVTANNRIHGRDYPHLLTSEWLPDSRAVRIEQLLRAHVPLTLDDHARIQLDTVSLLMKRFIALALPALNGAVLDERQSQIRSAFATWDGEMAANSAVPTIAFGWLVELTNRVLDSAVGRDLRQHLLPHQGEIDFNLHPFNDISSELICQWLESEPPAWIGPIRPHLLPALHAIVADLEKRLGRDWSQWQWGKLHYVNFHHFATRVPGLGRMWRPIKLPLGGDSFTPSHAAVGMQFPPDPVHIVASCRLIMDVGDWDQSRAVLPGGQSGLPNSPHYQDGLVDWGLGRDHPLTFSREKVESVTIGIHWLLPKT